MHLDGNLIASVAPQEWSEERHVRHTQFQFRIRSFAVQDPELHKSLVELNMIRNVKIDDSKVSTLVLTTPACPLRQFIVEDCQMAVKKLPGVTDVLVVLKPSAEGLPGRTGIAGVKISWQFLAAKAVWARVQLPSMLPLPSVRSQSRSIGCRYLWSHAPTMLGLDSAQITVRQGDRVKCWNRLLITASNWFQWAFFVTAISR